MLRQILTPTVARRTRAVNFIQNGAVRGICRSQRCCRSDVELTSIRYPGVQRGSFAQLNDKHVQHFRSILPSERVITDAEDVAAYNVDWLRMVRGWCVGTLCNHSCPLILWNSARTKYQFYRLHSLVITGKDVCMLPMQWMGPLYAWL
jgi:hypothetical protein